ncbi:short-chain dehydrogenase [Croceibacterium mercuriale]|uniref:Short-chain dehydrogenase n=1 Tax=Croceibacterium mercuriale TaxID=1572751 RepID=A0A0B2BX34_9SPHN|nr:SDR family oxidoreductase [Croceibacterium mercuriale]KHL24557.1 short-chain dehydrogenase [Croceibacterium mercuriale]
MSDRTILVTGGGSGIGRGTALHFGGLGWRVVALDRDEAALAELASLLPAEACLTITADCGQEADVIAAFRQVDAWLGGAPLTCLVNNSGIADPACGPLEDLALADWQRWIDASLTAAFLCSRQALPLLRRAAPDQAGASIVNISSTRALQSEPDTYAYAAAKGGLDALTHAMAVSLGPQVRVNAVLPGWIETGPWQKATERKAPDHSAADREQHPAGRVGEVADIARAIEYLATAGFVTGQQLVVDGGMTRRMIYA